MNIIIAILSTAAYHAVRFAASSITTSTDDQHYSQDQVWLCKSTTTASWDFCLIWKSNSLFSTAGSRRVSFRLIKDNLRGQGTLGCAPSAVTYNKQPLGTSGTNEAPGPICGACCVCWSLWCQHEEMSLLWSHCRLALNNIHNPRLYFSVSWAVKLSLCSIPSMKNSQNLFSFFFLTNCVKQGLKKGHSRTKNRLAWRSIRKVCFFT